MSFSSEILLSQGEATRTRDRLRSHIAILIVKISLVMMPVWIGFLLWGISRLAGLL